MVISTILWKIRVWLLYLFLMLFQAGCSMGVSYGVDSTYSTTEQQYKNMGFLPHNDPWRDVWPMITFDNGVTIKIHPFAWYSFTHNLEQCDQDRSKFSFSLYSTKKTIFDVSGSFFILPSEEEVRISETQFFNEEQLSYLVRDHEGGILLNPGKYDSKELHALLHAGDYITIKKDPGRQHLQLFTQKKVGCAFDYYRLYLSFRDVASGERSGYWLYFFPVEYKTFSR